jgi:hypothetical protein
MSKEGLSLDDLLRAVHNSVLKAQQLTEQQHMRQIRKYFDEDNIAICKRIWVPSNLPDAPDDEYMPLDVPLMSLLPPTAIKIKNLKINFKVALKGLMKGYEIDKSQKRLGFEKDEIEVQKAPLEIDLGGIGGGFFGAKTKPILADITIEFTGDEPSEAFMRINDHLIKTVKPEYGHSTSEKNIKKEKLKMAANEKALNAFKAKGGDQNNPKFKETQKKVDQMKEKFRD